MLRRGAEHLSTHAWARPLAGIEAGHDHGQVIVAAGVAAQEMPAISRCRDDRAAAGLYD